MPWFELFAIFTAGVAAGTINTVVGSGSLVTFPTLLAFGFPAITANVSNNIGLVPGGISGTWGYRHELRGQADRIRRLAPMSLAGSVLGAVLLLWLPAVAFGTIVPVLLVAALVLVVLQPRLQARVVAQQAAGPRGAARQGTRPGAARGGLLAAGTFGTGVYGGYFGAAQGVLLLGVLGSLVVEPVQRLNALKNLLSLVVNSVAALTFVVVAREHIDPWAAGLVAAGSLLGGVLGARFGRRLPPTVLRVLIVLVGLLAIARVSMG